MMCWPNRDPGGSSKPKSEVSLCTGLISVSGMVSSMTKRHGVLAMIDDSDNEQNIAFLASKVYLYGKRFPSSKMLSSQLNIDDKMYFDAIPCIPQEDKDNCTYFATGVFLGKRPQQAHSMDMPSIASNDCRTNYLLHGLTKNGDKNDGTLENKTGLNNSVQANYKSYMLQMINLVSSTDLYSRRAFLCAAENSLKSLVNYLIFQSLNSTFFSARQ